jgi:putative flippase GtrA
MGETARKEAVRIGKFLAGGGVNTAIGGGAILALQWMGLGQHLANAGGYAIGVPCGYLINRLFVFGRRDRAGAGSASWRYLGAVAFAFLLNQLALSILTMFLGGGFGLVLAQIGALATYTASLFALCRFWVFADGGASAAGGAPLPGQVASR